MSFRTSYLTDVSRGAWHTVSHELGTMVGHVRAVGTSSLYRRLGVVTVVALFAQIVTIFIVFSL